MHEEISLEKIKERLADDWYLDSTEEVIKWLIEKIEESNCIQQALFNSKVEALKENESLKAKIEELEEQNQTLSVCKESNDESADWLYEQHKKLQEENTKLRKVVECAKDLRFWMDRLEPTILQQEKVDALVFDNALKELEGES